MSGSQSGHLTDQPQIGKTEVGQKDPDKSSDKSTLLDWRTRFLEWKDIGSQYKTKAKPPIFGLLGKRDALPSDEIEYFEKRGIKFVSKLGSGTQGSVWLTTKTPLSTGGAQTSSGQNSKQYACKVLNLKTFAKLSGGRSQSTQRISVREAVDKLLAETSLHRTLVHKNIVRCEYFYNVEDQKTGFPFCRLLMFMELCDGDLHSLLKSRPNETFTEMEAFDMFEDVTEALHYLHRQDICHFDIKSKNIMYVIEGEGYCYKLGDFGLSKKFDSYPPRISGQIGTSPYMAPEMLYQGLFFEPKQTDIYSLGCVLAEALIGKFFLRTRMFREFKGNETSISSKYEIPLLCCTLISKMTDNSSSDRPTITTVRKDPWFEFCRKLKTQNTSPSSVGQTS